MHILTRREFLRVSALATTATLAAACVQVPMTPSEPVAAPAEGQAPPPEPAAPAQFQEAPMLAEQVAQGLLPPVDERLPRNPRVIPMNESIGKYGGILRRGFKGVSDGPGPTKLNIQGLVWFTLDLTTTPHVAEAWEINEDASEWTWHLREGTKWSDGHPLTTADVRYYYDHVLKNEVLTKSPPANWSSGSPRVLMELETPDDYTFVVRFQDPNPLFAEAYAAREGPYQPAHYMSQFHIDLAEDSAALQAQVAEAGLESWDGLYTQMNNWQINPERPVEYPWVPSTKMSDELFLMDRNPYYMAVDPEGKQLPYIDRIQHRLFSTPDVFNMWVVNGEIDLHHRHVAVANYTLFKENEEAGDYRVYHGILCSTTSINANLTTKDPQVREFLQNRDVRFALNYAVNREEINELIYDGLAEPRQCGPVDASPLYYPKLAHAYLEYDPEKANSLLDQAGYTERDAEGFRLWKDGSGRVGYQIEYIDAADEDTVALYVKYFADVGVQCPYKYVERSLYTEHYSSNNIEASVAFGVDRSLLPMLQPEILVGLMSDHPWACAWALWRTSGGTDPNGEEPPEGHWIWKAWDLYDQTRVTPDEAQRAELFYGILDIWYEELPMAGYLSQFKQPVIVKNGLRNYVDNLPIDTTTRDTNLANVQTFYWDEPEQHS